MRKIFNITLAALAAIVLAAACSKVDPVDETPAAKVMTIQATISDAATRVTFDPAYGSDFKPTAMAHTWQDGDKLRITDAADASKTALFDLVDGAGTATGKFQGEGFEAASYNVEAVPQGSFATGFTQTQAKDGATDHLQFVAKADGVTDLASVAMTETSGILGFIAKLPAGVAGTVSAVEIATKFMGFPVKVTINLTAQEDVDSDDVLKVYANAPSAFSIPANSEVFVTFKSTNAAHSVYTRFQKFSSAITPVAGKFNYIKMNCSHIDQYAGADDDGMEENPYKIADKYQLMAMKDLVETDNTTYFELLADIDLAGESWEPFNYASPYTKAVNFEGNGHKILNLTSNFDSYPSFAGVVAGDIQNVTFVDPVIDAGTQHAGVVGGYIGTTGIVGNCTGVTVENAKVYLSASPSKNRSIGGFGGMMAAAGTLKDCHVTGTTTITQTNAQTGSNAAGFIGNISAAATIDGCTAKADVSNEASYYTGGFIGQIGAAVPVVIKNSAYLGGTITAGRSNNNSPVGGFIGRITKNANAVIEKCYVDGAKIDAPLCGRSGGFVGESSDGNTITSCYVKNSTISAGMNTGGFVGVLYSTVKKSYVENTTVKANKAQAAGFAAYPENATITDCYTSANVEGGSFDSIGGFMGISRGGITVKNCYENGTITGTAESVGAFIGTLSVAPTSITKCVAWNASLPFYGVLTEGVELTNVTDNYTGAEGSIYDQAVALGGWDFTNTWTTDSTPKLR